MRLSINKIAFFTLFLDNLFLPIDLGFDFRVNYLFQGIFILFFFLKGGAKMRLKAMPFLLFVFAMLLLLGIINGAKIPLILKQFILIGFQLTFAWGLINSYKFNLEKIAKDYISICILVTFVALVQFISFKIGFVQGADYSYLGFDMGNFSMNNHRIQSWFQEPSFMIYSLMPALFMAFSRIFNLSRTMGYSTAAILILVIILSRSSLGFFGLLFCLSLIVFTKYPAIKKPIFLLIFATTSFVAAVILYNIPEMKLRVDDTLKLFTSDNVTGKQIDDSNLSTYALYSNYSVLKSSITEHPIFGKGLGQYPIIYDEKIEKVVPSSVFRENFKLNREDANSLIFRLLAETGIVGSTLFVFFVFKTRIKYRKEILNNHFFWAFNNGIFILIALRLLRQGHYSMLGFIFMLLIYFETYVKNKKYVLDAKVLHHT